MFVFRHHSSHCSLQIICQITSWGHLFSLVLSGKVEQSVDRAKGHVGPVYAERWIDIVYPAYWSTAQLSLLSITLWCHRTIWTVLWGLWRWTCHQVCDKFIVLAHVNISSACGAFSTESVQLG